MAKNDSADKNTYSVGLSCHVERASLEGWKCLEEQGDELLNDGRCIFGTVNRDVMVGVREANTNTNEISDIKPFLRL